jgi:hypothetical protein
MFKNKFIILAFLLQLNIGVFTQGIFDPPSYTQASCSGNNQWTTWIDSGNPNLVQGDFEVTSHIQQNFPSLMCSTPMAIEVIMNILFFLLANDF